jgi:ABC-2 type transport system permease protein
VSTWKALPTIFRVGISEAIAYRAEMVIWVLATTMPLVMMLLWTAVAELQPVRATGGHTWSASAFIAYFLCVFIVRQLVSSWACWEINYEVRQGLLAMRLLRPIHPVVSYLANNLAALPLRFVVTLPIAVVLAFSPGAALVTRDWRLWALWPLTMLGGWLITFFANILIGSLSFFMESSVKLMDLWLAAFFVFSGYLFPLDLFPPWLATAAQYLPFRFQIGLPVELMTGVHPFDDVPGLVARQFAWALGMGATALLVWHRGQSRYQAFGG